MERISVGLAVQHHQVGPQMTVAAVVPYAAHCVVFELFREGTECTMLSHRYQLRSTWAR